MTVPRLARQSVPHFATEGKGFRKVSSPATGSESSASEAAPPAVPPPATAPPPTVVPPAAPPADAGRGSRDMIAAINSLPEKLANVLLERAPVAGTPGQQTAVPAQVGSNSPGTVGASAETQSTPGQGNPAGTSQPPAPAGPTDAPPKASSFAKFWFGG